MIKKLLVRIINYIFYFFNIEDNKIIFESGRQKVDGNPLAIYQYIKKNCPNDFKTIWLIEKNTDTSSLNKDDYTYYKTFKAFYHLATAKYWIRSQSIGSIIKKKKNQIYIQTWHGGGAFKKCGYDIENVDEIKPLEHVLEWDYYIATDPYNAQMIQSSTGYNKKVLTIGSCRTDEIINFNKNSLKKIKRALNINDNNKKIILYAPTFRETDLTSKNINIPILELGENKNIIVLVRLHPQVKGLIKDILLPKNFINASDYPDIQDLLLITDILITDYSSVIFDFALLNRPIIFYAYDLNDYLIERNGFYLDYKSDLPGPIVYTEKELTKFIKNKELLINYQEKMNNFNKKYNYLNNGKVCERFIEKMKENYFK